MLIRFHYNDIVFNKIKLHVSCIHWKFNYMQKIGNLMADYYTKSSNKLMFMYHYFQGKYIK